MSDFDIQNGELVKYPGSGGNVALPFGVTSIGDHAFDECDGLTSVTVPEGVTSIGGIAFSECSALKNVTIPTSVTEVGAGAFFGCTSLANVFYDGAKKSWKAIDIASDNKPLSKAKKHFSA